MSNLPDLWRELDRPLAAMGSWRPLLRQLDDIFNDTVGMQTSEPRSTLPLVDVEETDNHFALSFDMPGVEKENIDIEVHGNQLRVVGERKHEREDAQGRSRFVERRYGRFERVVALPDGIKADEVEAQYRNGVLTIAIPKTAESKRQKIKIGENKSGILDRLLGSGRKDKDKETVEVKPTERSERAVTH